MTMLSQNVVEPGDVNPFSRPSQRIRIIIACDRWCVHSDIHALSVQPADISCSRTRKIKCHTPLGDDKCHTCAKLAHDCTYIARARYYAKRERDLVHRITRGGTMGTIAISTSTIGGPAAASMNTIVYEELPRTVDR
jgi:hypothetical protein